MLVWWTMLKKDIWVLKNLWFGFLGVALAVTAAVLTSNWLGRADAGTALVVGTVLIGTLLLAFPAQLYRGIRYEIKGASALWLHTPESGWAMLGSKLVSSLIGSLLYLVVCYFLVLALFHSVNLAHVLPPLHYQTQTYVGANGFAARRQQGIPLVTLSPTNVYVSNLLAQAPRMEFYVMILLLGSGLYLAMWITLLYMSARAVKHRFQKFSWLVGLGIVLVATWGLGALRSTAVYAQWFGWGKVPVLDLFPSHVRTLLSGKVSATIIMGHVAFNALIVVLLFYITGLIIDRYLEV